MDISQVLERVEKISQTLVMADPGDPDLPTNLAEAFGELSAVLMEMDREREADACRQAAGAAGGMAPGTPDFPQIIEFLGEMINALLSCLNGDCRAEDGFFPDPDAIDGAGEPVSVPGAPASGPVADTGELADDAIMGEFLSRQADTLIDVEKELLNMEASGGAGDTEGILRYLHTLKGESALLGLTDVSDLCHATEDLIQNEGFAACIDRLLDIKDWLIARFRHMGEGGDAPLPARDFWAALNLPGSAAGQEPAGPGEEPAAAESAEPVGTITLDEAPPIQVPDYTGKNLLEGDVDLIQDFVEEAHEHLNASEGHLLTLEADPRETEALNAVFRAFHTIKGLAGFIELDHVKDMAHKAENLLDMARRQEIALVGGNMDLVFESVDMMKRLIEGVTAAMGAEGHLETVDALPTLMGRLVAVTEQGVDAAAPPPPPAPEPEPEPVQAAAPAAPKTSGFIPLGNMKKPKATATVDKAPAGMAPAGAATPVAAAPEAPADDVPRAGSAKSPVKMKEAVRVDADRLDRLIETIGELVIAESMVSQSSELQGKLSVKLAKDLDHLDKICRELQEIGMSLRMVPVKPVFQKMARLVRDLSKKQGRQVEFVMSGEDTELDKNVVDKIGDPLVHMVRNAVDHGIEADPKERVAAGKPERGMVQLRSYHKGGNICIEIEDDGRGLDKEAIQAKAISRGLIREGEPLTDREIFNLIFEPGFSTAKQVTEISGRGVGMDVVRRGIEELRGTVDISSTPGKGSVFSIRLPLTLAIIEGMVVMVGGEHYIIPTLAVVRLIRPRPQDITYVFDRGEMLAFEGQHLPLFRLSNLFSVSEVRERPEDAVVVVVEDEGRKIGLLADELLGQQSIVIKSLGERLQGTDGVAGGAIMSDGNVALILDIAGIVRVAHAVDTTRRLGLPPAAVLEAAAPAPEAVPAV